MKISAIINGNEDYNGDFIKLYSYTGKEIAELMHIDENVLKWMLKPDLKTTNLYRHFSVKKVIDIFKTASKLFQKGKTKMGGEVIDQNEYATLVSLSTGMPFSVIINSIDQLSNLMENIEDALRPQIPNGDIEALERGYYYIQNKTIAWVPRANNLFVMTPSNHPNVNNLWLLAVALGYPVVLRPSDDDPFTPYRLIQCLIEAGFPKCNFTFIPSQHSGIDTLIDSTDLSMLFGDSKIKEKYIENSIKVFGPGRSAVIVDEEYYHKHKNKVINTILTSMCESSGRGCINASTVFFIGNGAELSELLAKSISEVGLFDPLNREATIGAIKSHVIAESYNNYVEKMIQDGYIDITEKYRDFSRMTTLNGVTYILPTILYQTESNMRNKNDIGAELPFPFVTFIDNCNGEYFEVPFESLSLSLLSNDNDLLNRFLFSCSNKKLFKGLPTNHMDFSNPHEEYLSRFLYMEKAFVIDQTAIENPTT